MPWEKQFDKEVALARAGEAFWAGGYEGTSMTALLDWMGIQKGSFYATFGSKHQVLLDALDAYAADRLSRLAVMASAPSPKAALLGHLSDVAKDATKGDSGCFLVNTALELSPRDAEIRKAVRKALAAHERHYRNALEAARAQGEVRADMDATATARGLLGLVLGMRVLARSAVPAAVIEGVANQAVRLLE